MPHTLARRLIEYLGGLVVTQGRAAGQLFDVLQWQRRFVRGAFAPDVFTVALSVARANGKTTLVAGIACASLDGPLMVARGETVLVASSFDQARIAFSHVLAFMRERVDLSDRSIWRVSDSDNNAKITNLLTRSKRQVYRFRPKTGAWTGGRVVFVG